MGSSSNEGGQAMAGESIALIAVGDALVNRAEPESALANTAHLIRQRGILMTCWPKQPTQGGGS